ncbi:MAG: hypothetical protein Q9203_001861 [Teloschistes exilis]
MSIMEGQEGENHCERYAWFKAVRSETSGEEEASRAARQRRDGGQQENLIRSSKQKVRTSSAKNQQHKGEKHGLILHLMLLLASQLAAGPRERVVGASGLLDSVAAHGPLAAGSRRQTAAVINELVWRSINGTFRISRDGRGSEAQEPSAARECGE